MILTDGNEYSPCERGFSPRIYYRSQFHDLFLSSIARPNFEIHVLLSNKFYRRRFKTFDMEIDSRGLAISRIFREQEPVKRDPYASCTLEMLSTNDLIFFPLFPIRIIVLNLWSWLARVRHFDKRTFPSQAFCRNEK